MALTGLPLERMNAQRMQDGLIGTGQLPNIFVRVDSQAPQLAAAFLPAGYSDILHVRDIQLGRGHYTCSTKIYLSDSFVETSFQ